MAEALAAALLVVLAVAAHRWVARLGRTPVYPVVAPRIRLWRSGRKVVILDGRDERWRVERPRFQIASID